MTHKINQVTKHKIWNIINNRDEYTTHTITNEHMENYGKNIDDVTGGVKVTCLCNRKFVLLPTSVNNHLLIMHKETKEAHFLGASCSRYYRYKEYETQRQDIPESVKEDLIDYKKGVHKKTLLNEIKQLSTKICKNNDIDDMSPLNAIKEEHYRLYRINSKYIALLMQYQVREDNKKDYISLRNATGRTRIIHSNRPNYKGKTFEELRSDKLWNLLIEQYIKCDSWAYWNQEMKKYTEYIKMCNNPPSENESIEMNEIFCTLHNIKKNFININDIENLKSNYLI